MRGRTEPIEQLDESAARRHLIPHFTLADEWLRASGPVLTRGEGAWVWDADGKAYLDGLSGLFCVNLGHGRQDLVSAATRQMSTLAFVPNWSYAHLPGIEAATAIADLAPGDLDAVFFVNSGSEAVESALKVARSYYLAIGEDSREKIIARNWAYHGTTLGALSITGVPSIRQPYAPLLGVTVHHAPNTLEVESSTPGAGTGGAGVAAIEHAILQEGPDTVAMVIAEPVQNGRGALVPPAGYWRELRAVCTKYDVLLCADEVITGFGRLGHWFACDRFDVVPDLITFAKGVTSGYAPLGGVVVKRPIVEAIMQGPSGMFAHGATFGAHPVSTAVALATIHAMREEGILDHVRKTEGWLARELGKLAATYSVVKEVRGMGFFYAIELMRDSSKQEELLPDQATKLQGGMLATFIREAGLLARADNRGATMLILAPPLIADRDVLTELVTRVSEVLERTQEWVRKAKTGAARTGQKVAEHLCDAAEDDKAENPGMKGHNE